MNSKGSIGRYQKLNGAEEVRIHFAVWELDGRQLSNVTIFPHLCGTCVGGDHTHVEVDDMREPLLIIAREVIELDPAQTARINRYLREKFSVNEVTADLYGLVKQYLV